MLTKLLDFVLGPIQRIDPIIKKLDEQCTPGFLIANWVRKMQILDPNREIVNERRVHGEILKWQWRERWTVSPNQLSSLPGTQLSFPFSRTLPLFSSIVHSPCNMSTEEIGMPLPLTQLSEPCVVSI